MLAFFAAPQARSLSSAARPFSFCVSCLGRAPKGTRLLQLCSYVKRCLRQYDRLHLSQCTPVTRGVLISVLQAGSAHCCSWVKMFGFAERGTLLLGPWLAAARLRAHSPALGHSCVVSDRWSRQNLLGVVLVRLRLGDSGVRNVPYPLQLSHLKGSRSSWRQKGIWQCAPIASTSPADILLKDSGWLVGLVFWEAMVGGDCEDD
jgi:hypothetical protein